MSSETAEARTITIWRTATADRKLLITDNLLVDQKKTGVTFFLSEHTGGIDSTRVRFVMDPQELKLLCLDVIEGRHVERTMTRIYTSSTAVTARSIDIRKDPKYRQPWVVKIEVGPGETANGKSVLLKAERSLSLMLAEDVMRRMAVILYDYVRDWEIVNFRKRQEAQTSVVAVQNGSEQA